MKTIELTQGRVAIVDDEDYGNLSKYKWRFFTNGRTTYAITGQHDEDNMWLMHHMILTKKEGFEVDHKDNNGLNNTRENLRYATKSQNRCNRGKTKANTSGYKGVFALKSGRWMSRIKANGELIYLGSFRRPEEAAKAYNDAAIKHHGEFACLNPL